MASKSDIVELGNSRLDFSAGSLVMGILNVTPDSFSDGGEFFDIGKAVTRAGQMESEGAAIIDIGAESTRPGAEAISADEQIKRAIPVIEALRGKVTVPISIDTYSYEVAAEAVGAGAQIINDISGLSDDRIGRLAAQKQTGLILMHMQGSPRTMQVEPKYEDVVSEVEQFLIARARLAESLGVSKEKIFIDPGIGFGKTIEHNLLLLKNIDRFVASGYRVLVGASRKGFLGKVTGRKDTAERIFATAATVALCVWSGAAVVRVHDVGAMSDVVKVTNAINRPGLF